MSKNKSAVLLGLAIGDAQGMFCETKKWNDPSILTWDGYTYLGGDFHKLKAGQTTDDTAMSLCLAESLTRFGSLSRSGFDPVATANCYRKWYEGDNFRGAGKTTRMALEKIKNGIPWYESGELDAIGSGTCMRVAPMGITFKNEPEKLIRAAKLDAIITHNSHEAQQSSIAVAMAASLLLNGVKKEEILDSIKRVLAPSRVLDNINMIMSNKLIRETIKNKEYNRELDKSGGDRIIAQLILGAGYTCVEIVARAFYVFIATKSFGEAIELAVRGGGDSDTVGAVVGAFCGAYYGLEGIPKYYIDNLENAKYIMEMDERLYG